jgi:hypothetical protein
MKAIRLFAAVGTLILSTSLSLAQPRPICGDTCGGGIQPTNTGGDTIQKWSSIPYQRGVGGAR